MHSLWTKKQFEKMYVINHHQQQIITNSYELYDNYELPIIAIDNKHLLNETKSTSAT